MYVLRLGSFFQRHLMTCYFRHVQIIHSCQIRLERTQNDTNISSSRHPDAGVVHNNLDVIRRKFKMNCVTVIFRSVDSGTFSVNQNAVSNQKFDPFNRKIAFGLSDTDVTIIYRICYLRRQLIAGSRIIVFLRVFSS